MMTYWGRQRNGGGTVIRQRSGPSEGCALPAGSWPNAKESHLQRPKPACRPLPPWSRPDPWVPGQTRPQSRLRRKTRPERRACRQRPRTPRSHRTLGADAAAVQHRCSPQSLSRYSQTDLEQSQANGWMRGHSNTHRGPNSIRGVNSLLPGAGKAPADTQGSTAQIV